VSPLRLRVFVVKVLFSFKKKIFFNPEDSKTRRNINNILLWDLFNFTQRPLRDRKGRKEKDSEVRNPKSKIPARPECSGQSGG